MLAISALWLRSVLPDAAVLSEAEVGRASAFLGKAAQQGHTQDVVFRNVSHFAPFVNVILAGWYLAVLLIGWADATKYTCEHLLHHYYGGGGNSEFQPKRHHTVR